MKNPKIITFVASSRKKTSLGNCKTIENELNVRYQEVSDFSELFLRISNPGYHTDFIFIDAEKFYEDNGSNVFDLVRTLSTLITCSQTPNILLVATVDLETDITHVKELINIDSLDGFFPRGIDFSIDEKRQALREITASCRHVPTRIKKLLKSRKKSSKPPPNNPNAPVLTTRQQQVLDLVTRQGASNKVIARTLDISESTVKLHMTAILKKNGARNRTQLVVFSKKI
jgi:DNA-binding NarL/FixJ family response regulator